MLVQMPATHSIAELVGQVKGASSHLVTRRILAHDGFFKWQGAYGAFSVSVRHLDAVSAYIKCQREHHAGGTTIRAYELDQMEDTP
jgi:putative transposase